MAANKITVIIPDAVILLDGEYIECDRTAFDALTVAQGHAGLHAIQWEGGAGVLEPLDGPLVAATAGDVAPYVAFHASQKQAQYNAMRDAALAQDAAEYARRVRDKALADGDYMFLSDYPAGGATRGQWVAYRAALRDLPAAGADWQPVLTWDDAADTVVLGGVSWPVAPV